MRKEVWRDVILSSVAFLALMWVAFFWAQKYFPMEQDSAAVAKVEEKKVAYLTFDDGPSKHTQEVLDILDTICYTAAEIAEKREKKQWGFRCTSACYGYETGADVPEFWSQSARDKCKLRPFCYTL